MLRQSIKESSHIHFLLFNWLRLLFGLSFLCRLLSWLSSLLGRFFSSWGRCRSSWDWSEEIGDGSAIKCFDYCIDKSLACFLAGSSEDSINTVFCDGSSLCREDKSCITDCKLFSFGHNFILIIKIINIFTLFIILQIREAFIFLSSFQFYIKSF